MVVAVLVLAVSGTVAAHGHGDRAHVRGGLAGTVPRATADRFDATAALRIVRLELRYGQRPAGSPQLRALAERLRALLPHGSFEPVGSDGTLRNVVATLPGRKPAIVVGAHYDTLAAPPGFVGANNGAAGSAIVVQLARTLAATHRPKGAPELRFVLFDGEEPAQGLPEDQSDFYDSGLRGSRAYVAAHPDATRAMLLLDYVANRGLRLPREGTSDSGLWGAVRASARRVGVGSVFPAASSTPILDDHSPFERAGVPAVDLIDWRYAGHDVTDTYDKLSATSADAVGETLTDLLRRAR